MNSTIIDILTDRIIELERRLDSAYSLVADLCQAIKQDEQS